LPLAQELGGRRRLREKLGPGLDSLVQHGTPERGGVRRRGRRRRRSLSDQARPGLRAFLELLAPLLEELARSGCVSHHFRCYAPVTPRVNESVLLGAGPQPAGRLGPPMDGRTASGDERDMAGREVDVLLLAAPHLVDERANAFGRRDVVLLRADDEDRTRDALETNRPAAHDELVTVELVVLIEIAHPLAEELAG